MILKPIAVPFRITQNWGVPNPIYAQFGFTQHNGVDVALGKDAKVFSPHEGTVTWIGWQPQGAGLHILIQSEDKYAFNDGNELYCLSTLMHLSSTKVAVGDNVKPGDLVAIADNTGFSTGPHTHWRLQRMYKKNSTYLIFDKNEANDSVDPIPYLTEHAGYFFTKDLSIGMTDPDVKELQKYLNQSGFPVASVPSAGSSTHETSFYGPATKDAVQRLQQAQNIFPASGYCGPLTRSFINKN